MVESIKKLRETCQPRDEMGIVARGYRKVSIYITKVFLYTSLTANQISVLFAICGVISGILFAVGNYWWVLLGSAILLVHYILDYVDGEVARYRQSASPKGEFIDIVCHNVAFAFVFSGIGYSAHLRYNDPRLLFMGFATASLVIISFSIYGFGYLIGNPQKDAHTDDGKEGLKLRRVFQNLAVFWTPFGITHIVIIASITGLLHIFFFFYTVITPIWLSIQLANWYSRRKKA
jgi:phosphatidylglycerophosphate synthase